MTPWSRFREIKAALDRENIEHEQGHRHAAGSVPTELIGQSSALVLAVIIR